MNIMQNLQADIERLSNFYWGVGYVKAGCFLNDLGHHFLQKNNDENRAIGVTLIDQSIKYFLCASILKNDVYSNQLIDEITADKGLTSLLGDLSASIHNWEEAEALLKTWVDSNTFLVLLNQAKLEVDARHASRQQQESIALLR